MHTTPTKGYLQEYWVLANSPTVRGTGGKVGDEGLGPLNTVIQWAQKTANKHLLPYFKNRIA